jgi:hypothetical protein
MDTYICLDNRVRINKLTFTPLYLTRKCVYVPRSPVVIGGHQQHYIIDELEFIPGLFTLEPDWMWETNPHKLMVF